MRPAVLDPDRWPWEGGVRAQGDYRAAEGLNQDDLVIGNPEAKERFVVREARA